MEREVGWEPRTLTSALELLRACWGCCEAQSPCIQLLCFLSCSGKLFSPTGVFVASLCPITASSLKTWVSVNTGDACSFKGSNDDAFYEVKKKPSNKLLKKWQLWGGKGTGVQKDVNVYFFIVPPVLFKFFAMWKY